MGKKKGKEYESKMIKEAIRPIIFIVIYASIPFIFKDKFGQIMVTIGLIPLMIALMKTRLTSIENSKSFINVKLCNYRYIHIKEIIDVWSISEVDQNDLVNSTFVEIRNIGETMVNLLKVIINHNSNKGNTNYIIQYALKKDEAIYLAISIKNDPFHKVDNITVIDYAGKDTGRNFYNKQPEIGDVQIFSESKNAIENKNSVDKPCYRIGLPKNNCHSNCT